MLISTLLGCIRTIWSNRLITPTDVSPGIPILMIFVLRNFFVSIYAINESPTKTT